VKGKMMAVDTITRPENLLQAIMQPRRPNAKKIWAELASIGAYYKRHRERMLELIHLTYTDDLWIGMGFASFTRFIKAVAHEFCLSETTVWRFHSENVRKNRDKGSENKGFTEVDFSRCGDSTSRKAESTGICQ